MSDRAAALPEAERNALLRRVDWRFLLPEPAPARTACFADGELARGVALVSGEVMTNEPPEGEHDLAVVAAPTPERLAEAWAALRPRGACYAEWTDRPPGGARAAARAMRAAGFDDVRCYWPWPSLERRRVWLPLDAPWVLDYYFRRHAHAVRHPLRRIAFAARHTLALATARLGLARPVCAIGHKGAAARRPRAARVAALELLADEWTARGLGPTPGTLSWLLLTEGPRSTSRAIALVFPDASPSPRAVVKMARVPEASARLDRESAALGAVHARHPHSLGVPRPILRTGVAAGETVIRGRQLDSVVSRGRYGRLARLGTSWLTDLAGSTPASTVVAPWPRLMGPVFEEFAERYGPVVDPGMLRETEQALAAVGTLPEVIEHRDFGPWNLLVTPAGGLGILDWEAAEPRGYPLLDLLYFLGYLATKVDRAVHPADVRRSYRTALDRRTFTGAVHHECVTEYARSLRLGDAAVRGLRVFLWVLHTRSEYARFTNDVAGPPLPDQLRRSGLTPLWEEEVRHGPRLRGAHPSSSSTH